MVGTIRSLLDSIPYLDWFLWLLVIFGSDDENALVGGRLASMKLPRRLRFACSCYAPFSFVFRDVCGAFLPRSMDGKYPFV